MNTKLITGGAVSGLLIAGGFAGMVSAQSVADATGLTEEEVIEIALTTVPGEVMEVAFEDDDEDGPVYEVEILTADGTEMEVEIDAQTGEVLEDEDGDRDMCHHDGDDDNDKAPDQARDDG